MVLDQETGTTGVSAVERKIVFHDKLPDYDARNQEIGIWLMADVISRVRKKHGLEKSTYIRNWHNVKVLELLHQSGTWEVPSELGRCIDLIPDGLCTVNHKKKINSNCQLL